MNAKSNYSGRLKSASLGTPCQVSASANTLHVCLTREVGLRRPLWPQAPKG